MNETCEYPLATFRVPADVTPPAPPQLNQKLFPSLYEGRKPQVAMLLYPGMTLQDLIGPHTILADSTDAQLVWKNRDMIVTDQGLGILPTATFDETPSDLDVLFVPGGPGFEAMVDDEILSFLADRGSRAKYVTSVCNGSLLLGAAGLLQGYRATSHWAVRELLAIFGAIPTAERVVTDRNRVTGGGVTAGIDFGLVLLSKLCGEETAKLAQLACEYDPDPPFRCGTPANATPQAIGQMGEWMMPFAMRCQELASRAASKMTKYTPAP